jgi:hypothetical protein
MAFFPTGKTNWLTAIATTAGVVAIWLTYLHSSPFPPPTDPVTFSGDTAPTEHPAANAANPAANSVARPAAPPAAAPLHPPLPTCSTRPGTALLIQAEPESKAGALIASIAARMGARIASVGPDLLTQVEVGRVLEGQWKFPANRNRDATVIVGRLHLDERASDLASSHVTELAARLDVVIMSGPCSAPSTTAPQRISEKTENESRDYAVRSLSVLLSNELGRRAGKAR